MNPDCERARYRGLLCLVTLLLCLPILSVHYVPLVDYPNHLARVHILSSYDDEPAFRERFDRQFEPIPNLAADVLILFLNQFVGILAAGKIFLVLTAVLFAAGCHLLGRAIRGRPAWLALPCCFFFYNSMLFYGFLNYMFGVGLFAVALAYWVEWREKWSAPRYACVSLLVLAAYLSHLSAYVFLGVAFAILTAWGYFKGARTLRAAAFDLGHLVPPLVTFAVYMSGSGEAGGVTWNTVRDKLTSSLSLILSYDYKLDAVVGAALLVVAILVFRRAQSVGVSRPTFVTGLVFALMYLIFPLGMMTAWFVDVRFIMPAALLIVLSLKVNISRKAGRFLLLFLMAVFCLRLGSVWATWVALDARIAAQTRALGVLPEGAKVYPLFVIPDDPKRGRTERAFVHVVHYATIYRRARVPTLFAWKSQQPLVYNSRFKDAVPPIAKAGEWLETSEEWLKHLDDHEYVWAYGLNESLTQLLGERASLLAEADGFTLWRLKSEQ